MVEYMKKNGFSLALYMLFGAMMSAAGVGVMVQPIEFIVILALVIVIDINSYMQGRRSLTE
mgnify:CR=1 FL=1